ncbi:hypothetical protein DRJ54_04335 [Candidatus Acetothermia bacterium]|nr:MAG: hypothetical protein DRJ54_04335 [Candidatus Acetothermia bacterium]
MSREKITLYGYFGHGNLGDEALREAWTKALSPMFQVRTLAPPRLPKGQGPWLFCGGLLQDRTSFRSLLFYLAAIEVAARRSPVALVSVGVDLRRRVSRQAVRMAVAKIEYLSVRDEASAGELSRLGFTPKVFPDPVLSWRPPDRRPGGAVLVNLVPELPPELRARAISHAQRLGAQLKAPVNGLVMAPEDARALVGLPLVRPATPAQALELLSTAPVLIAARLHALELALVAGTPFVALPYARKVGAFLHLVERELPVPVPRRPEEMGIVLTGDWRRGLLLARERLREEAKEGIRDVENWLAQVA